MPSLSYSEGVMPRAKKAERDSQLVADASGMTHAALAMKYRIGRARVVQILRKAGVSKPPRPSAVRLALLRSLTHK
jgi:Mor family transcriptional regulator